MRSSTGAIQVLLLLTAMLLVAGSSSWPEQENGRRTDETWLVANVWDGQTAVHPSTTIVLTVGNRDFQFNSQAHDVITQAILRRADTGELVNVSFNIALGTTEMVPVGGLEMSTEYVLDVTPLDGKLYSTRGFPPGPIRFSTQLAPRVVDLYRTVSGDGITTLVIEFSQPMRGSSLFVSQQSVDLVWQEGVELRSLAADVNLAGYVWDTADHLFLLAPYDFRHPVWLKIAASVGGSNGESLDSDGDTIGGTATDDYVMEIPSPESLALCFTRVDIPQPCIEEHLIPEFW